jgi:hypothetical protein
MTLSPSRRTLASALTGALAVAGLSVATVVTTASPAAAADPAPVLAWEVSQQYDGHLSTHTLTDGATEDAAGVITFPDGVGTYNPDSGTTSVQYGGQVVAGFSPAPGSPLLYSVTIADPQVVVDDAGNGELYATVASMTTSPSPASTPPTKVLVVTFDEGTWTDGGALDSTTVTPDYAGVLTPNSPEATALGVPADRPVDGKSFNPAFLGALVSGVRAHFYASQDNQPNKVPSPVTYQAAPRSVEVTTASASHEDGLSLDVDGTGFTGTDGNPGDDGVYVGLAPSGGLPDVSTPAGMDSFAGANWVPASGIVAGAFSTTVDAPTDALDPNEDYSVYTWRAHGHSTTSQDTETPVTIDWSQLEEAAAPAPSSVTPGGDTTKVFGATSTLTAAVPGTGSVTLTGVGAAQTKEVVGGNVSFTVPASLPAGAYTATLAYSGDTSYLPSEATRGLTVGKAATALGATWKKKPTTAKRGKLTITASGPAGVAAPTGDVKVKVSRKGVKHTLEVTLVNGVAKVKLPKLAAGSWKVKLTYPGAADYLGATKKLQVTV